MPGEPPSDLPPTASVQPTADLAPDAATQPVHAAHHRLGERPGDFIGPYKLLDIIGEGGFGTVFLAERREPMVQRVALKVIKPGMDTRAVIARFEQERQALAVMDHPNVAKVLDGGVTQTGRPYFVMEHVKGEPITEFCDRHRLTIKQRLELFIPVCEAVQHAHMKGIIHRDIKPSNILVGITGDATRNDSVVTHGMLVKVIDFGVAKAISQTLTDKTIFTEQGQIIGTPEYMSPEQAEMGAIDIDTRTDVYSLGVVLYELLSGTLPFDSKALRSAGYAEIQRIIREVDAPRPSTKLSTADDATRVAIAKARQESREKIAGELRRELEWIPLKALRKDRSRRYASAEAICTDVQRYLEGKPLDAAPESQAYLVRKFVRRNGNAVIGLLCTTTFLLSSGLWIAHLYAESERQRRLIDKSRGVAIELLDAQMGRADRLEAYVVVKDESRLWEAIERSLANDELDSELRSALLTARQRMVDSHQDDGVRQLAATMKDIYFSSKEMEDELLILRQMAHEGSADALKELSHTLITFARLLTEENQPERASLAYSEALDVLTQLAARQKEIIVDRTVFE